MKDFNNKQKHLKILNEINKKEIVDFNNITYGHGYWCNTELNMICQFKLKNPKYRGFIFRIWQNNYNKNYNFWIGGEHVKLLDRFKPERTTLSIYDKVDEFFTQLKSKFDDEYFNEVNYIIDYESLNKKVQYKVTRYAKYQIVKYLCKPYNLKFRIKDSSFFIKEKKKSDALFINQKALDRDIKYTQEQIDRYQERYGNNNKELKKLTEKYKLNWFSEIYLDNIFIVDYVGVDNKYSKRIFSKIKHKEI